MLHFSLSLMNRLNKTGSAIFISLFWFSCSRGIDIIPELAYQNMLEYYHDKTKYISFKRMFKRWNTRDDYLDELTYWHFTRRKHEYLYASQKK